VRSEPDLQAFGRRCDSIVVAYVAGQTSFDDCVTALADALRDLLSLDSATRQPLSDAPGTIVVNDLYRLWANLPGPERKKGDAALQAALANVFRRPEGAA